MRVRVRVLVVVVGAVLGVAVPAAGACEPCDDARALLEEDNCKKALGVLKKAIAKSDSSAELLGLQTACLVKTSKRKPAMKSLGAFLESDPSAQQLQELRSRVVDHEPPTPNVEARFDLREGVSPPIILLFNKPRPSSTAVEFGAAGDVLIEGVLGADGRLRELEENRSGDWSRRNTFEFGPSAMQSMNGWRFFPALKDGKPVAVEFKAIVRFVP